MASAAKPVAVMADEVPPRAKASSYPEPFASQMAGRRKQPLADFFGLTNFGVNLTRLVPGAVSALRHAHTKQDEFVYILHGRPTLHTDEGRTRLALVMYAFVLVKQRYVSGFALVLLLWILSSVRISFGREEVFRKRAILATILAPAVAMMWPATLNLRDIIRNPAGGVVGGFGRSPYDQQMVAEGLRQMGISPGTQVASIGSGLEAYWAHLAEVRIIAEIPGEGESFLAADFLKRSEALNKFLELGAKAVVTKNAAVAHSTEGWQQVGQTQYYVWRPSANSR